MRAVFLLLSAHIVRCIKNKEEKILPDKVIQASVSLEMLHVATLIHDDIIDRAPLRRGVRSVNAERGNELAILIGDLQFIQSIRSFANYIDCDNDIDVIRNILTVGFHLCCGEIDEILTEPKLDLEYLLIRYKRVANRKTAQLFGMSCEAGSSLMVGGNKASYFLSQFGRNVGYAFQIMDDLFDFVEHEDQSGKLPGADLINGRFSLPIIYALEDLKSDSVLHHIVKGGKGSESDIKESMKLVLNSAGFIKAYSEARRSVLDAIEVLKRFPESIYREKLESISMYIVNRSFESN
jgi:heptaprenyl diphosphate synthase